MENYTCQLLSSLEETEDCEQDTRVAQQKPRRGSAPTQVYARAATAAAAAAAARASATSWHPFPQYPMSTAAQGDPPQSLLLGSVLGTLPAHLFQQEVLRRLGPTDLASLAGAGRGCAAAVAATALMQWAKREKIRTAPEHSSRLCVQNAC